MTPEAGVADTWGTGDLHTVGGCGGDDCTLRPGSQSGGEGELSLLFRSLAVTGRRQAPRFLGGIWKEKTCFLRGREVDDTGRGL